jgi:hypothetical protein
LPRHSFRRGPWEPAAPNSLPPSRWPRAPAPVKGRVWSLAGSRPIPAGSPGRGGRPGPPRLRRESACPGASLRRQRPGRCRESPDTGEPGQTCLGAAAPVRARERSQCARTALNEPDPVTGLGGGVADQDVPEADCGGGRRAGRRGRKDHGHGGPGAAPAAVGCLPGSLMAGAAAGTGRARCPWRVRRASRWMVRESARWTRRRPWGTGTASRGGRSTWFRRRCLRAGRGADRGGSGNSRPRRRPCRRGCQERCSGWAGCRVVVRCLLAGACTRCAKDL